MILDATQIEKNIGWLLAHGSAPVRYLAHKHLLDAKDSAKGMRSLWREVEAGPCRSIRTRKTALTLGWRNTGSIT